LTNVIDSECSLEDFRKVVEVTTDLADYPLASVVDREVLIYERSSLPLETDPQAIEREWNKALSTGPGVIIIRGAYPDTSVVDRVSDVFTSIIDAERASGVASGDHFGKPGANARIWNAQEKLAVADPAAYVDYFANEIIALGSSAWLGPGYQITTQVNVVYPGGEPQQPHRDYHLGFQTNAVARTFPAQVHEFSPFLTLQGGVAHCDMSVASGPTMFLPHSQKYSLGYLAWREEAFKEYFWSHYVQLPLAKGDVVWFSPALFHGAGRNESTDVVRMVNLLQVSSAFGRAMETVDRVRLCSAIYPTLINAASGPAWSESFTSNVIGSAADGYPFPTNLDNDQPIGGLAPASQADVLTQALAENWSVDQFTQALAAQHERRTRT
jgi:ectoine hydroxylase-related dioxygenase (phytanoyl-CoA dioxygenase family)